MSSELVKVPRDKLNELISVVHSINRGKQHEIRVGGDDAPCYWQRKEWVDWALEVAKDIDCVVAQINDEPHKASESK